MHLHCEHTCSSNVTGEMLLPPREISVYTVFLKNEEVQILTAT